MENALPQNSQAQFSPEAPVGTSPNSNALKLAVVGLLVLLPIVGVGAYYFGKQSATTKSVDSQLTTTEQVITLSSTPVSSTIPTNDEAVNTSNTAETALKTYQDPLSTFTFKYPENFVATGGIFKGGYDNKELLIQLQVAGTEQFRPLNYLTISTTKTSGLETIFDELLAVKIGENYESDLTGSKFTRIKDTVIGNQPAPTFLNQTIEEQTHISILKYNNTYLVFTRLSDMPVSSVADPAQPEYGVNFTEAFNQVFTSFKFI